MFKTNIFVKNCIFFKKIHILFNFLIFEYFIYFQNSRKKLEIVCENLDSTDLQIF